MNAPTPSAEAASQASSGQLAKNRYFDYKSRIDALKVLPREYYVKATNQMAATVLGSCVSACVRKYSARLSEAPIAGDIELF